MSFEFIYTFIWIERVYQLVINCSRSHTMLPLYQNLADLSLLKQVMLKVSMMTSLVKQPQNVHKIQMIIHNTRLL